MEFDGKKSQERMTGPLFRGSYVVLLLLQKYIIHFCQHSKWFKIKTFKSKIKINHHSFSWLVQIGEDEQCPDAAEDGAPKQPLLPFSLSYSISLSMEDPIIAHLEMGKEDIAAMAEVEWLSHLCCQLFVLGITKSQSTGPFGSSWTPGQWHPCMHAKYYARLSH